jgi:hypothetical protein
LNALNQIERMIAYQCRQDEKGMKNERLRGKQRRREWCWGNARATGKQG